MYKGSVLIGGISVRVPRVCKRVQSRTRHLTAVIFLLEFLTVDNSII